MPAKDQKKTAAKRAKKDKPASSGDKPAASKPAPKVNKLKSVASKKQDAKELSKKIIKTKAPVKSVTGKKVQKKNVVTKLSSTQATEAANAAKKNKPASKHELKEIIENLKKEPTLIQARMALKHIRYYLKSTGLTKKLLKQVIRLWAGSHEKIRIICLLCIIRIFRRKSDLKEIITKNMYSCYIKNNASQVFMRQSLIEIFMLDHALAYKQGFLYCKQLASTLRNAYESKAETVCNWTYINCLTLWSNLISSGPNKHVRQLLNPVVELHIGTMNLVSSPRYYPLQLHLIANLVDISVKSDVFIPVLPLLTSILARLKPGSKPSKESFDFDSLLHVSESDVQSRLYFDTTVDRIYHQMVKFLASQCHKISFPELCLIAKIQVKKFVKNYKKESEKFRNLLVKLEENVKFIEVRRQTVDFAFTNFPAIDAWEKATKDAGKLSLVKLAHEVEPDHTSKEP